MHVLTSETGVVGLEDRHYPILVGTWVGQATVAQCREFTRWHDAQVRRALASGDRLISISDSLESVRPDANVRRCFADWIAGQPQAYRDASVLTLAVLDSALIRGALTAIAWIREEARQIVPVASMEHALEVALRTLDEHGIARPEGLQPGTYVRPSLAALSWGA